MKKTNHLITIALLFIVGLFTYPLLLNLTETITSKPILATSPEQDIWAKISFASLLALCAISARLFLWAYSKKQIVSSPTLIYSFALSISLLTVFAGISFNLSQLRSIPDFGLSTGFSSDSMDYLKWGAGTLLLAWIIVGFLLLSLHTNKKKTTA